jgi:hypothetical protein
VDANHLPCLRLHRLVGPLLSTFCGNGRDKTRDRLFEVVVSHGYFVVLTYATSHSVIDRVLESDDGNIFVQDTQRLQNGNVRIPDVGILHKITAHVDPSRRCGFPRSVQDVRVWKIDSKSSSCVIVKYVQ